MSDQEKRGGGGCTSDHISKSQRPLTSYPYNARTGRYGGFSRVWAAFQNNDQSVVVTLTSFGEAVFARSCLGITQNANNAHPAGVSMTFPQLLQGVLISVCRHKLPRTHTMHTMRVRDALGMQSAQICLTERVITSTFCDSTLQLSTIQQRSTDS